MKYFLPATTTLGLVSLLSFDVIEINAMNECVLQLHGSGTTNPAFCYWSIMETLTEQASIPMRMSYRSVGSTTGIAEFKELFINDGFITSNVFGSGDVPISKEDYNTITENGSNKNFIHLPVLAGPISFFHSVPDTPNLNLTACLLSQIYLGQISSWGDSAIKDINPTLSQEAQNTPIRPIRRSDGSSTGHAAIAYLYDACDTESQRLPVELVSVLPDWVGITGSDDVTFACEGADGVTDCIEEVSGSIGYIDVAHGFFANLAEVRLHNKDAENEYTFRTSQESDIEAAITRDALPASADDDFSAVHFLNQPGATTWPIVLMTYLYVPKNLTNFIEDPAEQSLLIAFLRSFYDETYVKQCDEKFGFTSLSENNSVKAFTDEAINTLVVDSTAPTWFFESDTTAIQGAGKYVFSAKREEIIDLRVEALEESVNLFSVDNDGTVAASAASPLSVHEFENLRAKIRALEQEMEQLKNAEWYDSLQNGDNEIFTDDDSKQIKSSLVLSSLSFVFWMIWIAHTIFKCANSRHHGNNVKITKSTDGNGDVVVTGSDNSHGTDHENDHSKMYG